MPNRKYSASDSYRYGFNGKENDNEVKGEGNQQDYGFRIYDPRLAKFLSVDPLSPSYPWYTPYQFAGNKPIWAIDLDGLEDVIYTNGIFKDEKFGKAQTLMVATDMGLKAITDVWNTETKKIKQDVYFVLSDDRSLFESHRNDAFTLTFDSKAFKDGKYVGQFDLDSKYIAALQQIDFRVTTQKELENGNVSIVFINKNGLRFASTVEYSQVIYHELQSHIVRNIDLPAESDKRSEDEDHLEYHGTKGHYSPEVGDEKKGSIMNKYLKEAKENYFNPDKKDNAYKPEPPKADQEKTKNSGSQSKKKEK